MRKNDSSSFVDRLHALPELEDPSELKSLVRTHGITLELLDAVIDRRLVSRDSACRAWADTMGIAYVDPFASIITDEAVQLIPVEVARKANVIGLYVVDEVLTVAMSTPTDASLVRRISQIVKIPVSPVFAMPREIEDSIHILYSNEKTLEESLQELERNSNLDQAAVASERLMALAESESVVRVLDEIIHFALRERSTDIHIEPHETQSRIRFRVDGRLRQVLTFSRRLHRALVSRLKILGNLNISEARFPQDGRFSIQLGSAKANFRLSTIPSQYGEKAVVRILAMTGRRTIITLEKMMMSQPILQPFRRMIRNPSGIIFVTGPTGSGKTTTLYSALHEVNTPELNISTIEDPIEIQLEGVNQSQINPHIDLNFSTLLRSLLRQDPDVILVGEIRDRETAKIATEAALTGHVVFATLHTNSAPQALVRLREIGVEDYMIAPSVIGVLAQRLAARICEGCKEAYQPSREELAKYFLDEGLTDVPFYHGRGCPACRGTGYKGRIAIHELLVITEEVRAMITERRSVRDIITAAEKVGYRSLRYDGLKKVLLGLTTIEELENHTSTEFAT